MLRNYIIIAARIFSRSALFSTINLLGLVSGITASTLLFVYVWDELRHDRFHSDADEIFRITTKNTKTNEAFVVTPGPLGPALAEDHKEISNITRVGKWSGTLRAGEVVFDENEMLFVENSFFHLFDFPLLVGNKDRALLRPDELVLTESCAKRYFGENWRNRSDIMGAAMTLNGNEAYTVAGVVADPPSYSSIQFKVLLSFEKIVLFDKWSYQWSSFNFHTYIQVPPHLADASFREKISSDFQRYRPEEPFQLALQPLRDIYLNPLDGYDWGKHGDTQYVVIFSVVGLIILVIACFNFINLSTARASGRAREVGVRKASGASRFQLFRQFLSESFLMVLVSVLVSRGLIDVLMPSFNRLAGKHIELNHFQAELLILLCLVAGLTGLLAGVYPALFLSSFKPAAVLKGNVLFNTSRHSFRSVLVVFQFAITTVLILATMVVHTQLNYIKNKDGGFNKNSLAYIKLGGTAKQNSATLKQELLDLSYIQSATRSTSPLINTDNESWFEWPGKTEGKEVGITQMNVDEDFLPMMEIRLSAGRNFAASDTMTFLLNESAVKAMGLSNEKALGMRIGFWGTDGTVIGIVNDFHYRPLHHTIGPLILRHAPRENYFSLLVRVAPEQVNRFASDAAAIYRKHAGDHPFDYAFVEDQISLQYDRESRAGLIILYFSGLSIFVCLLGLYGLVAYDIQVKTKELGIRRILGAGRRHIFDLLIRHFAILILLSFVFAAPAAWWITSDWLSNFSYRAPVSATIYLVSFAILLAGSLAVVFIQTWVATRKNVAEVLKVE